MVNIVEINELYFDPAAIPNKRTGVIIRKLLRNDKEYLPSFMNVRIETGNEYHGVYFSEQEHIDDINEIDNLYNSDPKVYQRIISRDKHIQVKVIASTAVSWFDDSKLDKLPSGKYMANVSLRITKYDSPKSGPSIKLHFQEINIIETIKMQERMNYPELPEYKVFVTMNAKDRWKFYNSGFICKEHENNKINYCLAKDENDYLPCHKRDIKDGNTMLFMGPKSEAKVDYIDRKLYHYAMVLGYSDDKVKYEGLSQVEIDTKFMSSVKDYLTYRKLDVRGLWYDRGHGERAHANLHVVCSLPLHYFRTLFIGWHIEFGKAWMKGMFNPVIWRLYGSRNHTMFCTDKHDFKEENCFNENFQEGSVVFHQFRKFLLEQEIVSGTDLVYSKEKYEKVFDYPLYEIKQEDDMTSMFETLKLT